MIRNRFKEIKRFLHFADNDCLPQRGKMKKIHPLQEAVNSSLQQFEVFAEDLSVDKQIVSYFGSHSCKICIRHKPIRFSYKNLVLGSRCGYRCTF